MQFQFSKKQPLTLNNYNDKFIFTNKREFDAYDNFLFENQTYLKGGATYQSWNQVTITLTYTENLWHELSKTNYVKIMVEGTFSAQYYFINNYSITQKNRISVTAILDVWMTYHTQIVFKENASVFVDRMSINRWKSLTAKFINMEDYCLIPNWSPESPLWQPENNLPNMDNKIVEEIIPLRLQTPNKFYPDYNFYENFLYKGEFIYMVFKYNTNTETGKMNYTPPYPEIDERAFTANPMPFFIIPLTKYSLKNYTDFIDNPYLQGIYYSQLPWFDPTPRITGFIYTDAIKANNPIVSGGDWKRVWKEDLPGKVFTDLTTIIRADLINSFFEKNKLDMYESFPNVRYQYVPFGVKREKEKFSPNNEPKLYMFPYFEIDYVRGKRTPLVIHNERWHSDWTIDNFETLYKISVLETFTPFYINSYRYINQGLYNTGGMDLKYSIDLSGTNNLISMASPYKEFLNSYLANYNTGKNQKAYNTGVGAYAGLLGVGSSALAGASLSPLGALGGAVFGAIGGVVNMIQHTGDNAFAQQQQKNQLIDLARQPDTANKNDNPDTYLELELLKDSEYTGVLRTRSLPEYNRYQIAYYFHKFGYTYNRNLIVDNWDKLLIRDTWNYIKIEQFSNCIDLEKSNIPWQAILQIDEIFKQGIRLWNHFSNYETVNKLFDYDLPNWEKGIIWGDESLTINLTGKDLLYNQPSNTLFNGDSLSVLNKNDDILPYIQTQFYNSGDDIDIKSPNKDLIIEKEDN